MQYMISLSKTTIYFLLTAILIFIACTGSNKKNPGRARIFTGTSSRMAQSAAPVDNFKTSEIFFTLKGKSDCITVQTSAEYFPYPFAREKKIARTFFIFERLVDLSRYGKKNAAVFTELSRNFSDRWGRQRKVTVCNSPSMPLQRIDDKSLYRIRVTTFIAGSFDYVITVFSDTPVRFFNSIKDYRDSLKTTPVKKD